MVTEKLDVKTNENMLMCTLKFIKDSHRFDNSLL